MHDLRSIDVAVFPDEDLTAKCAKEGCLDVGVCTELADELFSFFHASGFETIEGAGFGDGIVVESLEAAADFEFVVDHYLGISGAKTERDGLVE